MAAQRKTAQGRGEARRVAILDAAWDVFREVGFEQASMDEIRRRAGGSKVSLYANFGNKEGLFVAVVRDRAQAVNATLPASGTHANIEQLLAALASAMIASMTSSAVQDLHRVALSARMQGPEIGRLLYENGTKRVIQQLAETIDGEMKAGRLRSDDPLAAAEAFFGLLLGAGYVRFALGVPEKATAAVRKQRVARAIRIFLAAYEVFPNRTDSE